MTAHHRVRLEWMGSEVETLSDLIPDAPRAICVGINPAPTSVAAGHYYQGRLGRQFFARLARSGVITLSPDAFDDDIALEQGIGFTDVVKRPTSKASEVTMAELRHGARLLAEMVHTWGNPPLIFPFKKGAEALVGRIAGNGWLETDFEGSRLFVMPGPYESRTTAERTISRLAPGLPRPE